MMKKFNFKKKEQEEEVPAAHPPPVPKVPVEQSRASVVDVEEKTGGGRFGLDRFMKKKKKDDVDEEAIASPPPPPPRTGGGDGGRPKKSRTSSKKSKVIDDNDDDDGHRSKSSSSSCCGCKRLLTGGFCLLLLATAGIITWRYGPWASRSSNATSLVAANTCDKCCNGLASNCDLPVNDVLFPMVHNAHSSYADNFMGANNNRPFEEALVAGYRALGMKTCECEGFLSKVLLERDEEWGLGSSNLGFCHTACGAGVRDPKDVMTNLKTFLETNPREVLIIKFDMGEGSSADLRTALQYSGLLEYVYHPQDEYYIEEWPTLKQLIDNNTRLILFGSGDGMDSCPAYDCDDGILYANDHFSTTSDLEGCDPTISGDVFVGYLMMNHYEEGKMKIPSPKRARDLNSYANLEERFETCEGQRMPNLLAVEFWDEGEALDFVKNLNAGKNGMGESMRGGKDEVMEKAV
eukprot:CAMPEP_0181141338 /NCGR_PEP_ID=MMETSP1071-20121207/35770_1 /TAXON_ID=35127 /ORGANISM="Thalassiosira sp., Strain NH16" /LENGTH=462 /DNA_ID=CAMNT_0023228321 /DNA_START=45 /DNA_END=1431 /DNA_ORIENTATION=-